MKDRLHILLIDDDEDEYFLLKEWITRPAKGRGVPNYRLDWISTYEEAVKAFSECNYDLYLVDYRLRNRSGLDLLREPVARQCSAPVIMLTGQGSYAIDLSAMQLGVADYLEKDQLSMPLLERSIRYAIDRKQAEKQLETLVQERTQDLALMKKQAQELAALQKATSSLLHTLNLSQLMGQILDAAQEAIPSAEKGWLHIIEHQHGRSRVLTEISLNDPRIRRIKFTGKFPDPLATLADGQSLLFPNPQGDAILQSLMEDEPNREAIHSAMMVPLILGEEVLGALSLTASRASAFTEAELQLLTSFAATATAAIYNAILYSETQNLAATDPLTGQLNRRTFFELAQREIDRFRRFGRTFSWIMFDIDWFKEINDQYGHPAGDQVLSVIVERCCEVIRHVDILGRYGGDEFVILLPETDHQRAKEIAERIRTSIRSSPIITETGPILVSISMGVTQVSQDTADIGILLNKVDQALYKSKQAGRDTVTVLP